jgi:hypothetical protein
MNPRKSSRSHAKVDSPPMPAVRLLLAFFDRDFLFKLILALLVWMLVPVGEIFSSFSSGA